LADKNTVFTATILLLLIVCTIALGIAVYAGAPDDVAANPGKPVTVGAPGNVQSVGKSYAEYTINISDFKYSDFYGGLTLSGKDGDVILLRSSQNPGDDRIYFELGCDRNITWWKGLSLSSSPYYDTYCQAEINSNVKPQPKDTITVEPYDLKGKTLVLCKGKFLGVHAAEYAVADTENSFTSGYVYTFIWIKD
jgi:hypothetical protein